MQQTSEPDSRRRSRSSRADAIIAAAAELFGRRGYESTSVSDIAGAVGVADGAIYRHFPSKRAILYEVISTFYEPVIEMARTNLDGISDLHQRLRYLIWLQVSAFAESPELCRLIIQEGRPMQDYYESEIADLNRRYTSLLVDVVTEGQHRSVFRDDVDATFVRDVVYGAIEHIAWGAVNGRSAIDADATADQLVSLLSSGLDPDGGTDDALVDRVTRLETIVDRIAR